MTTAQELLICKKTVLKPYIIFLKMVRLNNASCVCVCVCVCL